MYQISSEAYLDRFNECYKNIVVISPKPNDASLNSITRAITREKIIAFSRNISLLSIRQMYLCICISK